VLRFESQGDTQQHLEKLKGENERHIEAFIGEREKLQEDFEQMKYTGEDKLSR